MNEISDARDETLVKLAQSRAEIRRLLEPQPRPPASDTEYTAVGGPAGTFPRSRTMKLLLSGRGIGTVGAMVGGLLLARPALAFRLLRMLPTGAIARMLLIKAISTIRSNQE